VSDRVGEAEVEHDQAAIGLDPQVPRLEVAVQSSAAVQCADRLDELRDRGP